MLALQNIIAKKPNNCFNLTSSNAPSFWRRLHGGRKMPFFTEPTEAECFEAEQELLFDLRFRQEQREIKKMINDDKLKGAKNTEQEKED
jgi:hypothetical protein